MESKQDAHYIYMLLFSKTHCFWYDHKTGIMFKENFDCTEDTPKSGHAQISLRKIGPTIPKTACISLWGDYIYLVTRKLFKKTIIVKDTIIALMDESLPNIQNKISSYVSTTTFVTLLYIMQLHHLIPMLNLYRNHSTDFQCN